VRWNLSLSWRLAIAGAVLGIEKSVLNLFVDFPSADAAQGFGYLVRVTQHAGFRFAVSLAISAAVFAYLRGGEPLAQANAAGRGAALQPRWLALHAALVLPLVPLSMWLYGRPSPIPFALTVALWLALAGLAAVALLAALAPWPLWRRGAQALGPIWLYAVIAAAGSVLAMGYAQSLWIGMARLTFDAVGGLLSRLIPDLELDPAKLTIDTGNFAVGIDPICSGLEGMSLMVAFCAVLLVLFRRELIFPRALWVIPAGVLLVITLNVVRIAALVLIGHAGHQDVAVYGFHSQAGWLAFNAASAGIAVVSLRSPWLNRAAVQSGPARNPTAIYLVPFLALLLAGMVSKALSPGFETFYWLRVCALVPALWYAGRMLRGGDWRFSWRGPLVGALVFLAWIALFPMLRDRPGAPDPLSGFSTMTRLLWIAAHLAASVLLVPIAEELAFRGFLLRRLRSVDFETLAPRAAGMLPLLLSSIGFGLCHGSLWFAGTLAGLAFGALYMRTGRLSEAIAAHVTANALIAVGVLAAGRWQLW
jgi:exosortase E/protease (VPEID-CTERM system)